MVRLGWVARRWSYTLILDGEALLHGQVLIRRIAPDLLSNLLVELLGEGLRESIGQGLNHHVVVIITAFNERLAHFVLVESSGDCEEAEVVLDAGALWCDEVAHGHEGILVLVGLLAESAEFGFESLHVVLVIDLNVVLLVGVAWVETDDAPGLDELFINNFLKHSLSIIKKLLSLLTHCLVLENLWIGSIRVLAPDLPCLEEWVPVDERKELCQVVLLEDLGTEDAWLHDFH